jgi:hypothetical protein
MYEPIKHLQNKETLQSMQLQNRTTFKILIVTSVVKEHHSFAKTEGS